MAADGSPRKGANGGHACGVGTSCQDAAAIPLI